MRKEIRIRILLKTPLGGAPPPIVFEVGRFVAWKEVLKDCVVKLGVLFKSQVMRGVSSGSGRSWAAPEQVLGRSWAAPGHLGRLLGGSWAVLGGSWALLGGSWAAPGPSWALLGGSWAILGCLGRLLDDLGLSWTALVRSRAALERSWAPCWSQVGPQEAQSRPQDPPKSKPRRYKTMLTYKKLFRTPSWELRDEFLEPSCRKLGAPGAPK